MGQEFDEVLEFWFTGAAQEPGRVEARLPFWFETDPAVDLEIKRRFGWLVREAAEAKLTAWESAPRSCLALVILLDQFPRNLARGSPQAFAHDAQALELAERAVRRGYQEHLAPLEQVFLLMPFQHSESLEVQRRSVHLFERLRSRTPAEWESILSGVCDYARKHLEIVERFGRFPHRNAILGRASTPAERIYLASGAETFGQSARENDER